MPPTAFSLNGDVAIVTGAGSRLPGEIGNGRAAAIVLARQVSNGSRVRSSLCSTGYQGAKVALLDINIQHALQTKKMIDAEGGISQVIECDVTDEESCKAAVARTVELFGAVHILVNIVGVGGTHGTVVNLDLKAWDRDFKINVCSTYAILFGLFNHPYRSQAWF